jgi:LysR family hydrogen peroxide-inducible transcriptional activator
LLRGRVVLGTLGSLAAMRLPAVLGRFRERYPGIDIALREDHSAALAGGLAEGAVDLALVHAGSVHPRGRSRPRPFVHAGLSFTVLEQEEMLLIMPCGHRLARSARVRFVELADEPFVLYKDGSGSRDMMLAAAAAAGFTPRSALEATGNDTVRAFVAAGFGVSLLPRSLALAVGPPVAVASVTPRAVRVVSLGRREHGALQPAVQALHTFLHDSFRGPARRIRADGRIE